MSWLFSFKLLTCIICTLTCWGGFCEIRLPSFSQKFGFSRKTGRKSFWVWTKNSQDFMKEQRYPKTGARFGLSMPTSPYITTFCFTILFDVNFFHFFVQILSCPPLFQEGQLFCLVSRHLAVVSSAPVGLRSRSSLINFACIGVAPPQLFTPSSVQSIIMVAIW